MIDELELRIANFLRFGVIVAGIIMFSGWISQIKFSGNPFFNFEIYDQISFMEMIKFHIYRKNWGTLVSYAGLVSLICLPIIRVILTAILFLKQKEFALASIAFIVLIGLAVSMSLGFEL